MTEIMTGRTGKKGSENGKRRLQRFGGKRRTGLILLALLLLVSAVLPARAEDVYCAAFDKFVVSAGECVNVREKPELTGEILAEIYPGQVLESIRVVQGDKEKEDGTDLWYEINLGENRVGYAKYDYFLHGEPLQKYLLSTERIYADVKENVTTEVYSTAERKHGKEQAGPTGEQYNVLVAWDGLLELDELGFVEGNDCELTFISQEEKTAREAALFQKELPDMVAQLAELNEAERMAHPELFTAYSAVTPETTMLRAAVVAEAQSHVGLSYVWGGTNLETGVDCSGLTMRVYEKFGVSIGRTTRQQAVNGRVIDPSVMQPGDLIFYADEHGVICHVVMYVGNGMCVHARSELYGVLVEPVPAGYSRVVSYLD